MTCSPSPRCVSRPSPRPLAAAIVFLAGERTARSGPRSFIFEHFPFPPCVFLLTPNGRAAAAESQSRCARAACHGGAGKALAQAATSGTGRFGSRLAGAMALPLKIPSWVLGSCPAERRVDRLGPCVSFPPGKPRLGMQQSSLRPCRAGELQLGPCCWCLSHIQGAGIVPCCHGKARSSP